MGKCSALMIFLSSSLLLVLQTLHVVNAVKCFGNSFNGNSSTFAQNRQKLFPTLADKVIINDGFYNASLGQDPDKVYALVSCARGYDQDACYNCVQSLTQNTLTDCRSRRDSFIWGGNDDVTCLVRSSNQSTFGSVQLKPPVVWPSPDTIESSKNITLFKQQWEEMVNRTLEAATKAEGSSVLKYYKAEKAGFTEFPDVYMLMQCTPDLSSRDCKQCLGDCVMYFRKDYMGRKGGMASLPSCYFRWDLYSFHNAFDNVTRVPAPPPRPHAQEKESCITVKKGKSIGYGGIIAIVVVFTFINLLVFIGFIKVYARRGKLNNVGSAEYSDSDGQFMLRFDLGMIVMATDDFSSENTLGQGGFGTVYKGTFPNGQEVAVKRLTKGSGQGDMEFKNEVSLLTRLQHKNLVKLLGFCNEGDEEILVYEFVPNSSLDHFIFDEDKRSLLTWEVRFRIIEGIARGLLYLHEDSQLKIIHRDLKASNILLDAEMNPKVADFGTARLFDSDETRAETKRIAGTRGYMAPEYLNHGQISAKSDVYSFGVMLLEMISGERNNSFEDSMALVRHSPSFDFLFHFPVDRSRFLSPVAFSSVRYHRFHSCRWLSLRSSPSCSRRLNSFSSRCSITNTDVCHEFVTTDDEIHEDLLTPIEDHSIPIVHLDTNISVTESLTLLTECTYVDTVLTALPVLSEEEQTVIAATPAHPEGLYVLYASCLVGNLVEQLWNFAWPSAIAMLYPSLLPVAVMGFVTKLAIIAGGPVVGKFMDYSPRVPTYISLNVIQAAAQVLSAGMIIHAYTVPSTSASSILLQPWFFALLFAGAIDSLCGIASGVAIERDWVVLLAGINRPIALAQANAVLHRIDLLCEIAGTMLFGILLSKYDPVTCLKFAATLMVGSLPTMTALIWLTNKFSSGVLDRPKCSLNSCSAEGSRTNTDSIFDIGMETIKLGWKEYIQQPVLPASLAYVLLYFNIVLTPGSLMTAFLTQRCVNPSVIGGFSGLCAVMGVAATFLSANLVKRVGILKAGAVGLFFQASLLAVAVAVYCSSSLSHKSPLFFFLSMIVLSRLGHMSYGVVGAQILQTGIPSSKANLIGATEISVASLAESLMLGVAIAANDASHFGFLAVLSLLSVVAASLIFCRLLRNPTDEQRRLFSFDPLSN